METDLFVDGFRQSPCIAHSEMVRAQLEFDVWMPLLQNILLAPGTFLDLSLDPLHL